ncbi:hypothetical protein cce_0684 [Crocosphaera subtropica ATCC 51142]|uniref:Uncharacterized protein n=1 Tax=Crocosphaera subtropica (strain ATCC 51142 / BH68) TaxID=43989 RepID=B1WQB3_CROS5|nr:hypothetical protein cce_0684 [Crocosphaera subtropica ATCC 51142]
MGFVGLMTYPLLTTIFDMIKTLQSWGETLN